MLPVITYLKGFRQLWYWIIPLLLTAALALWTVIVSPYSEYGDYWAIVPAFVVFPATIIYHFYALLKVKYPYFYLIFSALHLYVQFYVWLIALFRISKDSL